MVRYTSMRPTSEASTTAPRYATNGLRLSRADPPRHRHRLLPHPLGAGRDRRLSAARPLRRRQGGLDDLHADHSVHRAARVHDAPARERLAGSALKIVGLGGSLATHSRSRGALETALTGALEADAQIELLDIRALDLALYNPDGEASPSTLAMVEALEGADGLIWSTPLYQGSVAGSFKN